MRRKKLKLALAGAVAFVLGFLSAMLSAPAQEPARFDLKVRQEFFAGFAGDRAALDRGMKACEDTLAASPNHPEAMVWHGGGLAYRAGQSFQAGDQAKGMDLWTRGLAEMHKAVELAPDDVAVRIPRGATLLAMSHFVPPSMADPLLRDGMSDYERTYELQKSNFQTLGSHPRGELLFGMAEGYARLGDSAKATAFFEKIRADLPASVYAKRADVWLETKKLAPEQTQCVGCHVPGK